MDHTADLGSTLQQGPPPASKRSPAAADKGDEHRETNLACLPDVVLANLFKMLPVPDRGRLARTCLRLSSIMQCPSVWTDVCIQLHVTIKHTHKLKLVCDLGSRDSSMVEQYGAYFQRATIVFPWKTVSQEVCEMLSKFIQREVKMKLMIQLGVDIPIPWKHLAYVPPRLFHELVDNVIDVIDACSSSTSVSFEIAHYRPDLFGFTKKFYCSPKSARFCSMLTELVLPKQWSEQTLEGLYGLSPTPTAALISKFYALQRLTLSLHNASEELLLELSDSSGRRSPLRSLVLQHMDGRNSRREAFPQLSSAAWSNLTSACPSLTVQCYFACHHMPPLSQVIKPETPLVKLKVTCNNYSDTDSAQVAQVCREHERTLQFYRLSAGIDLSKIRSQHYLTRTRWNVPV